MANIKIIQIIGAETLKNKSLEGKEHRDCPQGKSWTVLKQLVCDKRLNVDS